MNKPLIVCALEVETQGKEWLKDFDVVYTGVGKVNATYALTTHFGKYGSYIPYSLVINYGTAGSRKIKKKQLVVFPEGKINKYGKKLLLKEGLYRLALLASKKTNSIFIIPIWIAYSQVTPKIRSKASLCFGEPILVNKNPNLSIKEFNEILNKRMYNADKIALETVGR